MSSRLADAEARERIRNDLASTLFVEAAAGTGKTTALVGRIVSLLRGGAGALDRIVAVTFTEKAAGEMKLRLRAEIESARAAEPAASDGRARLDEALARLEVARIGTIHGFCGDLLRERPVAAGVDPLFEVAPEEDSQRLLDRAFDSWFEEILSDPPEGVRRVLRRRTRGFNALGPRQQLRAAASGLVEHRDFTAAWRRDPFDREGAIDRVLLQLDSIAQLAELAPRADDWLARNLSNIGSFLAENRLRESVRGRDYDSLESELRELARDRRLGWHWVGRGGFSPELDRSEAIERRNRVKAELDALLEAADADLAPCLHAELRPVVERYEVLKQRAGVLDFLDLLLRARNLVRDDAEVRAEIQQRFTHYFVDEFQDTDPLQAELLLLLASANPGEDRAARVEPVAGKLFLVGDPKQAIYRFRRADVATYETTKRKLIADGAELLHLTTSFRAAPSLQQAVNAAFEPVMNAEAKRGDAGGQARYVALQPWRPDPEQRPTLVALPAPRPYGDYGRIVHWRIDESFPDAVGAFVDWLVHDSGWTVGDGEPIDARHVCLIFRRFKSFNEDVTRPYVRALEARRVPHVLVGGHSFHDREEVLALRNALSAIEWPDDDLRVFATLRGPLFALGDDALVAYRHRFKTLHPLRPRGDEALSEPEQQVADALDILAGLHRTRNRRAIGETISELLGAVRAHAGIAIWPTGEQSLANCLRVIDLARRFEGRGATSFRAFVEHLEQGAQRNDAPDAPVVEEGTEGVRIMTAHRAKGLEFPVVILADPNCRASRDTPSRYVDTEAGLWAEPLCGCAPRELLDHREDEAARDAAEAVRLTYVAATRARDLLVVPVVGDAFERESPGWVDVLLPVCSPEKSERRRAGVAPGCPPFGEDSVFERPPNARAGPRSSVAPGLHRPQLGAHGVVWWDPAALQLDVQEQVGLRQSRILEADRDGVVAEKGERAHASWQSRRSELLSQGARDTLTVQAVTQLSAADFPDDGEVGFEQVDVDRERPGGSRFGTLVHATLAVVDLDASPERVRAAAAVEGRLIGAPEDEVAAAGAAVAAALRHPLLRRAAASDELRRETPVMLALADDRIAEGVVDLAFRDANGWTVVDFKTDRELEGHHARYETQLRVYARAIHEATGEPTTSVLLSV